MDLEKQKRNQLIKVIITEILMVLAIIPIVVLLTLLAMGYRLCEDLSLEQSGLIQVNSIPNGAMVKVDGKDKFRTDASRMLTGGSHNIEITKDGYDTWTKTVDITPGILLRVRYPRLFKQDRKTEEVETLPSLKMMSAAPNRTRLILQVGSNAILKLVNIRNDEVKMSNLDLSGILTIDENGNFLGTIEQTKWSWNGDAVMMKVRYSDRTEWVLADMRDSVPDRNLTKSLGLAISDAQFAGDSTEWIYVLENSNLREVNLNNNGISRVLLSGVEEFYAEREYVGYVGKENGTRVVGVYHNGDTGGVVAEEIADDAPAHVAVSEYYGEKYLSFTIGPKLKIYEGENLPIYGGDLSRMRLIVDAEIEVNVNQPLVINRTGEAIIMRNDKEIVAVDLETKKFDKYGTVNNVTQFIDDYLLYGVSENELYVWDFDGENKRLLSQNAALFPAIISANNHWLYYIAKIDEQTALVRERVN